MLAAQGRGTGGAREQAVLTGGGGDGEGEQPDGVGGDDDGKVEQGRRAATATRRSRGVGGDEVGDLVKTAKCCIYSKSIGPGS